MVSSYYSDTSISFMEYEYCYPLIRLSIYITGNGDYTYLNLQNSSRGSCLNSICALHMCNYLGLISDGRIFRNLSALLFS